MRIALSLLLVAALQCQPPQSEPAGAYRAFVTAIDRGADDEAWALLSKATREQLTASARAVAQAEGKPLPADGKRMAFSESVVHPQVKRVENASVEGDRAAVQVIDEHGTTQLVTLVREDGRWRLDLSEAIAQSRSQPQAQQH